MAATNGYTGKILVVDLATNDVSTVDTQPYAETYIAGRALGARLYWENVPPECGALDPENCLIFCVGLAAGTLSPGGSRTSISTKAPAMIPEAYSTSTTGGSTGAELKFAGYDGMVVKGKAEHPVYIRIANDAVEILPAVSLWGKGVTETDHLLKQRWGYDVRNFVIGPAGENLDRYAAIMSDITHATGQGGFGAVMGSKNLKAICIRGTGCVQVADPQALLENHYNKVYLEGPSPTGTLATGPLMNKSHGLWPVDEEKANAFKAGSADPGNLDGYMNATETYAGIIKMVDDVNAGEAEFKYGGCFSCPGPCHLSAKYNDIDVPLGSMNLCHQPGQFRAQDLAVYGETWSRADYLFNNLCSDYGLSVDVMGVEHEWFNDLLQAGYITAEDLDLGEDFDPMDPAAWLDENVIREMVRKICYRDGWLWSLCADGPDIALDHFAAIDEDAKRITQKYIVKKYHNSSDGAAFPKVGMPIDTITYMMDYKYMHHNPYQHWRNGSTTTTKGMTGEEKAAGLANARAYWGMELFGTDNVGDEALEEKSYLGKGEAEVFFQNMEMEMDSMCYCGWAGFPSWQSRNAEDRVADAGTGAWLYNAIMGGNRTFKENVEAFAPAAQLMRCIHVREGRRKEHDLAISPRIWEDKEPWGSPETYQQGVEEFYEARGWDVETGIPRRSTLEGYGLQDVADDLEQKYGIQLKP